jgi:glutamate-5-semialdehyde dehydrogenase
MRGVQLKAKQARSASLSLGSLSTVEKNQALELIAEAIKENSGNLIEENRKDVAKAKVMLGNREITEAMLKRLALDESKIGKIVDMVKSVAKLEDPVSKTKYAMELDDNLELYQVTSSIGVIGVIFESRPDALVQIASLCLKSGNSVILKGGSEAKHSNKLLFEIIKGASSHLPDGWIQLLEERQEVKSLLDLDEYVDLLIPRGSNQFVRYIQDNTRIPVLGHSEGVCHIYVDSETDISMALNVCYDSKVQYPAVCNAVDTILVHNNIADSFLPPMFEKLLEAGVEVKTGPRASHYSSEIFRMLNDDDWNIEYLDYIVGVKVVNSLSEAIDHINEYGSHHTDAIITKNKEKALKFMRMVDSACVFWNASTRFSDGYRYGLGAEVGISTGKIHARGPTGLEGLTSYKYYLKGNGQIVADYSGNNPKRFKHKRLNKKW